MSVTGDLLFGLATSTPGQPANFEDVTVAFINATDQFGIAPNVVGVTRPDLVTVTNTTTGIRAVVRGEFPAPIPLLDALSPTSGAYQNWINAALPVRVLEARIENNDFILDVDFGGAGPTLDDFYYRWTPDDLFALSPVINDVAYGPDGTPVGGPTDPGAPVDPVDPIDRTGSEGPDELVGDAGNDRLIGLGGDDTLRGGDGADTLNGGDGDDVIFGGLTGTDLRDQIFGGAGNDHIESGAGNDQVFGQDGNDTIAGGGGVDELQGQDGDDVITGSAFSDLVFGGAGNDFVNGGFGHDRINGGTGADKFFHAGVEGHGSDWVQDYVAADGDVLLWGGPPSRPSAVGDTIDLITKADFQVNLAHTANAAGERAGDDAVQEAFVIYKPTEQILWALVDGAGQDQINIQIDGTVFDLLA